MTHGECLVGRYELVSRDLCHWWLVELVILCKIRVRIQVSLVDMVVYDGWLCSVQRSGAQG